MPSLHGQPVLQVERRVSGVASEIDAHDLVLVAARDVVDDADLARWLLDPALDRGEQVALPAEIVEDPGLPFGQAPLFEDTLVPDRLEDPEGDLGPVDDDGDLLLGQDLDAKIDPAVLVVEALACQADLRPPVAGPAQALRQGLEVGGQAVGDIDVPHLALHPPEERTLGDLGFPFDLEPADTERLPVDGPKDEVGRGSAFLPLDLAHDDGLEEPGLLEPLADFLDGRRQKLFLEIGPGPLGCQAFPQRRRGDLGPSKENVVDEHLPDEVEDEGDPPLPLPRDPDVGEEPGAEDLLDRLVDEPRRKGVARPERDEVEQSGFPGTPVDPDDDAVDDRGLLGPEGPRAGPRQDDGEGEDRPESVRPGAGV